MAENQDFLNSPGFRAARESFESTPEAESTQIDWFLGLDWSAISQVFIAGATVTLAIVAVKGLHAWKHPIGTKLKLQFIDDLIDAVHEYVSAMNTPVTMVRLFEIEIKAYSEAEALKGNAGENDGFIKIIESHGEETGKRFFQHLDNIRPIVSKIQSLITKGQVLGFEEFDKAYNACTMLIWSHGHIEGLAAVLSGSNLNWENLMVQETLNKYRDIKSSEIAKNLADNHVIFLEFAKNIYKKLLT